MPPRKAKVLEFTFTYCRTRYRYRNGFIYDLIGKHIICSCDVSGLGLPSTEEFMRKMVQVVLRTHFETEKIAKYEGKQELRKEIKSLLDI